MLCEKTKAIKYRLNPHNFLTVDNYLEPCQGKIPPMCCVDPSGKHPLPHIMQQFLVQSQGACGVVFLNFIGNQPNLSDASLAEIVSAFNSI